MLVVVEVKGSRSLARAPRSWKRVRKGQKKSNAKVQVKVEKRKEKKKKGG